MKKKTMEGKKREARDKHFVRQYVELREECGVNAAQRYLRSLPKEDQGRIAPAVQIIEAAAKNL